MRRRLLTATAALALSFSFASAATLPTMTQIIASPELQHGLIAGAVYDLDTHKMLFAHNAETLMEAASTTKTLTTGTSLALLGPGFRWTTPVYRTGAIDAAGVLQGDLVLVASGDPNLSQRIKPDGTLAFENEDHSYDGSYATRAVPGDPLAVLRQLARDVRAAGITSINGSVVVDATLFPDQGPEGGTGAIVSPIVVNDNLVDITVTPGSKVGDPVAIAVSPQTSYVKFVVKATTAVAKTEPTLDYSDDVTNPDGSHTVTFKGKQPMGAPMLYAYRVPEPKVFAQDAFTTALTDAGVTVTSPAKPTPFDHLAASASYVPANLVAKHISPPLSQDVYVTLKVSDNLHASLLVYMWAIYVAHVKDHLLRTGFSRERALLTGAGLDLHGASQQDGLGTSAFFTPDFMVHYLAWTTKQSWFAAFKHGLPIMGVDGTLFNIQNQSPAAGKVFAKTGSWGSDDELNAAGLVTKGLAGFMTTRAGHRVAFAFYINRMAGKSSVDQNKDATHHAGELLGAMATATYESL